ncbi:hypothetical protein B4U79_16913 [Dinothrombium tinctorium]|uniref:Peptidase M12A domain-containing protein n=2 Tax=Dinothrombium tinctorium TaxID=1965070 RepID=A0A3S3NIP7_9ACAR|nr:hypothetical protein B4U79_17003 [Dinothrombium tinctorium]RWS00184.1 hypothetical protein B4U79_16913 [Dinothrombium tinctorium]
MGFYHEHQRPDAAKYVKVDTDRLTEEQYANDFEPLEDDWIDFNVTNPFKYDYKSILHYCSEDIPWYAFLTTPLITKANGDAIDCPEDLSEIDKQELDYFYSCQKVEEYYKALTKIDPETICYQPYEEKLEHERFFIQVCVSEKLVNLTFCKAPLNSTFEQLFTCDNCYSHIYQTYHKQTFEDRNLRLTSDIIGESHWHLNFGNTPSKYNPDVVRNFYLNFNHYLHLGNSRQSYKINPLNVNLQRTYELPIISVNSSHICIAFNYKMWGNGNASLEIGLKIIDIGFKSPYKPIALFEYKKDEPEYPEYKVAIVYQNIGNNKRVQFNFAGEIDAGANIAIDNITVFRCEEGPYVYNRTFVPKNIVQNYFYRNSNHYHQTDTEDKLLHNPVSRYCCELISKTMGSRINYEQCIKWMAEIIDDCETFSEKAKTSEYYKQCCLRI